MNFRSTPLIPCLNRLLIACFLGLIPGLLSAREAGRPNPDRSQQAQPRATRLPGGAPADFEVRSYKGSNDVTIAYSLLVPENIKPDERYPLVLCLHGGRGASKAAEVLAEPALRKKHPGFIMAPATPRSKLWTLGGIPADFRPEQLEAGKIEDLQSVELELMEALEDVLANYPVDPNRIYITGQSKGGHGTWGIILNNPERFAAAAPICGPIGPVDVAPIARLPIWIFHGNADSVVSVDYSRRMVDALREAGGSPGYTEFPGVGHSSWVPAYEMEVFWDWLFSQRRSLR